MAPPPGGGVGGAPGPSTTPVAVDHTRAIVASLFAPGPQGQPHPEQHVAHVQTYEGVVDTPTRKARFLIISAVQDGRLKLHKAKENSNGTFSIGKTWGLEELRGIEVGKRTVDGMLSPQPLEFVLTMNGKTYRYETELPSSQQAAFLVKMVRCWRTYMHGRGQPDLVLVGFSVDNPSIPRSAPPSRSNTSNGAVSASRPTTPSQSLQAPGRPSTANSARTVGNAYPPDPPRPGPTPPPASGRRPSPAHQPSQRVASPPPFGGPKAPATASSASRTISAPMHSTQVSHPPPPPQRPPSVTRESGLRSGSATSQSYRGPSASRDGSISTDDRRNGSASSLSGPPPGSGSAGPLDRETWKGPASRNGSASTQRGQLTSLASGSTPPPIERTSSSPPAAAEALRAPQTTLLAPTPKRTVAAPEDLIDDDAVLANVEEMLEGFEWRGGMGGDGRRAGKADEIEKRLVGELKALEAASIHAIMESDDRVTFVIKHLDDALAELDKLDLMVGLYKSQLNLMTDDIAHIESQNRGLQVQTSNQRALLSELDNLLETIHIPESDLQALSQESLENQTGIDRLEKAGVSLYKALLSTRDTAVGDMAAASERGSEYRQKSAQFCKRIFDFLAIMFKFQVDQLLNPKDGANHKPGELPSHDMLEDYLGRYCGLMLFVKEIDQPRYQQICTAYFAAMSDLHKREIQELIGSLRKEVRKPTEEELEAGFSSTKDSPTIRQQSMRRVGTVVRSPMEGRGKDQTGKIHGSEAFRRALLQITPHVIREQGFVSDFLHINELDASITFADYMSLEAYFRRGATSYLASQQGKLKDIRGAMELVFGFLEAELRDWIDSMLKLDSMQIVGVLAALDGAILLGEEERSEFLLRILQKQYQKSLGALERACREQIKSIEQTKLTLKKRKGVVPFVRVFPMFVTRMESQLEGAYQLKIRNVVNDIYERIVHTIFESLQQMAKMDGEGQGVAAEDKDQLNYHVIIIENMHHIVAVFSKQNVPALGPFVSQARDKYTEHLDLYIKLVLRRPLARPLDFFHGLEQLLRTTPPTEVSLHSAYTKSALRRVTSDVRAKDLRKAIDVLYKRVDKHFGDVLNPSAEHTVVIRTVWKACEDEMQRLTTLWKGLIEKCYPDERTGLDFTKDDVHEFFSKAHVS